MRLYEATRPDTMWPPYDSRLKKTVLPNEILETEILSLWEYFLKYFCFQRYYGKYSIDVLGQYSY